MSIRSILRHASSLLLLMGGVVLGGYAYVTVQAHLFDAREMRRLASLSNSAVSIVQPHGAHELATAERVATKTGSLLGELEIPRIGIDTLVLEGDESAVLLRGAGHIPETAMPNDPGGNVGIAAHRDTYFRPLRFIRAKDLIVIKTPTGIHQYRVQSTRVVEPEDVAVLDNTGHRVLTLVTCYPFYFVGSAPHRFIVRATAVE
jgi:sortase A